jgi:hypothetical protein
VHQHRDRAGQMIALIVVLIGVSLLALGALILFLAGGAD